MPRNNIPLSSGTNSQQDADAKLPFLANGAVVLDGSGNVILCTGCPKFNVQWKKCSDDTNVAVFSPANSPSQAVAWVLSGGVFIKAYADGPTSSTPTDPCFIENQTTVRTICGDLAISDFSDNFNDGIIDPCLWDTTVVNGTGSTLTESTGKLRLHCGSVSSNNDVAVLMTRFDPLGGDFELTGSWTITHASGSQSSDCVLRTRGFTGAWDISKRKSATFDEIVSRIAGSETTFSTSATSGRFRIKRVGTLVEIQYDIGAGFVTLDSGNTSDTLTGWRLDAANEIPTGNTNDVTWEDFLVA